MADVPSYSALALQGIVETCINVSAMSPARTFYESVFNLEAMIGDDRFCAFRVGKDVLLLFVRGGSDQAVSLPGGTIPPHDTIGAGHFALAISPEALADWRARLQQLGIAIESEVRWERGGTSIYFRDPDNNLLELATPGIWANY